jgi:hypothetical protein
MEDILVLYKMPYNREVPVICMDEKPVQLIKEMRPSIPAESGHPVRYDWEYERAGTAAIFMYAEPLGQWRKVKVRERRTSIDWAEEIKELLDIDYPQARKVILICDNLNTHKIGSLYEAFPATEARRLAQRLEIHYTPIHGSWLNIAEIELSALSRQCLKKYKRNIQQLRREVEAWYKERNLHQKDIDWQFTTEDARIKLKWLYPKIKSG